MLGPLLSLRDSERRPAFVAFAFLSALVAGHALLETARDALFLARLPAGQLPLMYLAIAGLSLLLARVELKLARFLPRWAALPFWSALAGVGTAAFYAGAPAPGQASSWFLYALYVWTGIIASLVLVHFWSLLAEAFSVTQAKRLYPLIGSGSVCGALLGSALASSISRWWGTQYLLSVAAGSFALATL